VTRPLIVLTFVVGSLRRLRVRGHLYIINHNFHVVDSTFSHFEMFEMRFYRMKFMSVIGMLISC
jgi:hypothetical protein